MKTNTGNVEKLRKEAKSLGISQEKIDCCGQNETCLEGLIKEKLLEIYKRIQNNEEVPPSEYSKIDLESEVFKSLDSEMQTIITDYIYTQSEKIVNAALEEDRKKKQEQDTSASPGV